MLPMTCNRIIDKIKHIGASWDKLAPAETDAIKYAHKHINPEPQKMIDDHHYSPEYCLAHSGESINDRFRENRPTDIDKKIADIVAKTTTDSDLVLYRGVGDYTFDLMIKNAKSQKNCDFYESAFMSCSLLKDHELLYKKRLRVYVPAGSRVIYLGNVNDEQEYYEVVIMRGAKLKIVSADHTYINCRLIETE